MITQQQKHIAAIHDLSGAGRCSLTVALPVISAAGVTCSCIPTALLSTHTGEFTNYVAHDLSAFMLPIAKHWKNSGLRVDGIYSGYLASPKQAEILSKIIDTLAGEETLVIVDPVMADNGAYYANLDERMCAAFRTLVARADLLTPNVTEAALLTGLPYRAAPHGESYIRALFDGLFELGAKTVALTGVSSTVGLLGNAIAKRGQEPVFELRETREGVFYGTGDLFASALSALTVLGVEPAQALRTATDLVDDAVANALRRGTPRRFGVDFENALAPFIRRVDQLRSEKSM